MVIDSFMEVRDILLLPRAEGAGDTEKGFSEPPESKRGGAEVCI